VDRAKVLWHRIMYGEYRAVADSRPRSDRVAAISLLRSWRMID